MRLPARFPAFFTTGRPGCPGLREEKAPLFIIDGNPSLLFSVISCKLTARAIF